MGAHLSRLVFEVENDRNHILNTVISSQAGRDTMDEIFTWLFYAPRYPSLRMECPAAIPGSRVFNAAKEIHRAKLSVQKILPTNGQIVAKPTETNPILQTIERNTIAIQELTEARREAEGDKSQNSSEKGFNKLPSDIQNFLLAIASTDLENPAEAIANSGLDLLKMSQKNAISSLARLLKKQGRHFVNLSTSHSNEIVSINWFAPNNPFIGLSTCRIPAMSKSFTHGSVFEKAQTLELLHKLEIEKQEILETLTDKSLHRPLSTDDVIRNVEIIQSILEIYLGPQCAIVQRIVDFTQNIKRSSTKLEFIASSDDQLLTKIQYLFDSRLNSWLEEVYENAENLLEVDHSLIEFSSIIQSIAYGSFSVSLPSSLQPTTNRNKRTVEDTSDTQQKQKQKKGATNSDPNPNWKLKEGESWDQFNKDPNNLRPASVCLMFHIIGHCSLGTKCRRAKSHCKLTNEAQIKQTDTFIEDCRKNARP
jgi:hypothetical protein